MAIETSYPQKATQWPTWRKPVRDRGWLVIIVFDEVTMLNVAGAAEVFAEANRFGGNYQLKIASVDGRDVTTSIETA